MRVGLLTGVAATALLATGCAVAPHGGGKSVTHDVANYLHREWPLAGPPVIPPDACQGSCACCGGGATQAPCGATYGDDWDQASMLPIARGYTDDPPPAVPLGPGPPGRFFPVPVKPPFSPQGPPTGAGF